MEENRLGKEKYLIFIIFTKHTQHYFSDIVEKRLIACNITFLLNNFLLNLDLGFLQAIPK